MVSEYRMEIMTSDQGKFTISYQGNMWRVTHEEEGVLLHSAAPEVVAAFLVGRIRGLDGNMIDGFECMLCATAAAFDDVLCQ